jgi:type IV pilus assembly protein PilW
LNPPVASVLPGDANTDVIALAFGVADNFVEGTGASQVANSAANFTVKNPSGFNAGDLVVGVQVVGGVRQCAMHEITNVPGGQCGAPPNGGSNVLIHNTGNYKNSGKGCSQGPAEYNRPAGIPGIDALGGDVTSAMLYNLGPLPINLAYAIRNNDLTVCDRIRTDCTKVENFTAIASDIVSLRAVYGKDTNNDGTVDVWNRVTPATDTEWIQVAAARIEIVARSAIKERVDPTSGVCEVTTNAAMPDKQTWMGQKVIGAEINLSTTDPEWQCYRYKLFQSVVPFRNLIWQQKPPAPPAPPPAL